LYEGKKYIHEFNNRKLVISNSRGQESKETFKTNEFYTPQCLEDNDLQESIAKDDAMLEMAKYMKRQHLIQLTDFDGSDPEAWPAFHADYVATTIEGDFKPHENLRRLRTHLKGDAMMYVRGYLNTPESVDSAIDELRSIYGRAGPMARQVGKITNSQFQ
jgi:hypothetical protein